MGVINQHKETFKVQQIILQLRMITSRMNFYYEECLAIIHHQDVQVFT